ncbi:MULTISPECIES: winged helix-turn-helix transcriptional regulator [Streptomyces]|uniref:Helix-turn-helix transcriptional regulator n=2 Tax=Streptomyces TaxID=1883 RepID=A0ABS9JNY7_9ACTN|nr:MULTISPECIES: helix-turn-helix domain-containing protein [Streptomyces]MCG0067266.1 helix-turn-helix transcriptional regulator [Streptomyces tricolor]MYU29236.1 transcriptional regulator [Streptomyces sp. SID7810]BCM68641.1 putative transcriptional regulator [Streptomyces sp. EAS-AB2608]CUW30288.1 putative HTH-type transcriptional regulator YybR [Streptomyces reticuli]
MATMTAAQRREQARADYDAFLRSCPTNQLLGRLSDKWVSLVVAALAPGPLRYSDLGRKIAGVSPKMLTQTLRALERDGIISRTVTPSVPVRVDYALTPLGTSLAALLTAVKDWAETHFDEVRTARERYDAENPD